VVPPFLLFSLVTVGQWLSHRFLAHFNQSTLAPYAACSLHCLGQDMAPIRTAPSYTEYTDKEGHVDSDAGRVIDVEEKEADREKPRERKPKRKPEHQP
jgi:hypothetical protein